MMKGDLHTLKKVCLYGSKVMFAGTVILMAVVIVLIGAGAASFFVDSIQDFLGDCIDKDFESDSAIEVAAAYLELLLLFILAAATVYITYLVMKSIHSEHSPFNEFNTARVKVLSQTYLAAAFAFAVLEIAGSKEWTSTLFMFFGCILVSVILYSLSLIIRYGAVLQNESDHTL